MKNSPSVLAAKRYEVFYCQPSETLGTACQKMLAQDISALVVTDAAGYLVGILSRTDLLRAHLQQDNWMAHPVSTYMSPAVITVSPETTLVEVAKILVMRQIHRVVVVQSEGHRQRPLAVVSDSDLIYHMAQEIAVS
jgi:CBS domain-containing protein